MKKNKKILMVLPRGEAIRNFVYSRVLERLATEAEVSVASVRPSNFIWRIIKEKTCNIWELHEAREPYIVRLVHGLLDLAHTRFLWSEAGKERWRLRSREAIAGRRWGRWLAKSVVAKGFASQRGIRVLEAALVTLAVRCPAARHWFRVLGDCRPHLVFNGSHVHGQVAMPLMFAAASRRLRLAAFIFSWDNLTSQGRIVPRYDDYLVWTESMREQLVGLYPKVRRSDVHVTGTPQFDFHFWPRRRGREEVISSIGGDPARPLVLYTTGMANHMEGEPALVEWLANQLALSAHRPQLAVRVYAKDLTGRFQPVRERRKDILFPAVHWQARWLTPEPEDCESYSDLLAAADVAVNVASTVSLEAMIFEKPVINVAFDPPGAPRPTVPFARYYEYDHYRPVVESGAVWLARRPDDLLRMIDEALVSPKQRLPQQKQLLERFFGETLDGRSGERVATVLLRLAAENHTP